MPEHIYIDNATRKKIVTFWIPVCLMFLHAWSSIFVVAMVIPKIPGWGIEMPQINVETAYKAFKTCNWGIWGLILLLISDKAVELIISRAGGVAAAVAGQTVKKTTEEIVTTTPATTITPTKIETAEIEAENVNIK